MVRHEKPFLHLDWDSYLQFLFSDRNLVKSLLTPKLELENMLTDRKYLLNFRSFFYLEIQLIISCLHNLLGFSPLTSAFFFFLTIGMKYLKSVFSRFDILIILLSMLVATL